MSTLRYYPFMTPKPNAFYTEDFKRSWIGATTYGDWGKFIEGSDSYAWRRLCERFAEDFQFAVLRGITVVAINEYEWRTVFHQLQDEVEPFQGMSKLYMTGQLQADWRFFATRLAEGWRGNLYYPALHPKWLLPYGYTQQQYLRDLPLYWNEIHDDYYVPWEGNLMGKDSPEVARLKKLGQVARQEIDKVALHSTQYLKR